MKTRNKLGRGTQKEFEFSRISCSWPTILEKIKTILLYCQCRQAMTCSCWSLKQHWYVPLYYPQLGKKTSYFIVNTKLTVLTINRRVKRATTPNSDMMEAPWYSLRWTWNLPPAWNATETQRIARIESSDVREAQKVLAGWTFVARTTGVPGSVTASYIP
jgi:hypothetical protein